MFIIKTGIEYVSIHTPTQGVTKPRSRASLGFFVSIHTPTQGVTYCRDMIKHKRLFQSTHPRRVWPYNSTPSTSGVSLQSTHPRRVWRLIRPILILIVSFNPHTHAGCDLWTYYYLWLWCCFNPHTHAGCDKTNQTSIDINRVSIHTPTQGVTLAGNAIGASSQFQSTHPRRVWHWLLPVVGLINQCFNPHTHAGCDLRLVHRCLTLNSFNPHTHAGCDRFCSILKLNRYCFNPHTHAGCDKFLCEHCRKGLVSIHTPTQGVTRYIIC